MARPAPSIDRTVAILNFLAAHPDDAFTLSELCRRLSITKATAHAMLNALADAGYLLRHPTDKTFTLGPALIAVGSAAAARRMEVVDYARDEMRRLAGELRVQVVATTAMGEEIVVLAREGEAEPFRVTLDVGQRLPLVPPIGTVFVAWSPPGEIDRWLRRGGREVTDAQRDRYRAAVEAVRRRGWSVGVEVPGAMASGTRLEELAHDEYLLLELEKAQTYRLSHISAPVFGPDGTVVLALNLLGFPGLLRAEQVPELADRLVTAALTVTKSIHGRAPDSEGAG